MRIKAIGTPRTAQLSSAMTDISFNLIIFFLVSAVFIADHGLYLQLPDADEAPLQLAPEKVVLVKVSADGSCDVDGLFTDGGALEGRLASAYTRAAGLVTIIESGPGVTYQQVLGVLEAAKKAGGLTFSLTVSRGEPLPVRIDGEEGE